MRVDVVGEKWAHWSYLYALDIDVITGELEFGNSAPSASCRSDYRSDLLLDAGPRKLSGRLLIESARPKSAMNSNDIGVAGSHVQHHGSPRAHQHRWFRVLSWARECF